ncbi:MAG: PDZ domain-containing protein [Longimicrobiaceae bacterium]
MTKGALFPILLVLLAAPGLGAQEEKGWIGIAYDHDERADHARITEVFDDSPAERAGLRRGDVLVRIDGRPATREVLRELDLQPGQRVRLRVLRDGREQEITVRTDRLRDAQRRHRREITIHLDSVMDKVRGRLDSVRAHLDTIRLPRVRVEELDSGVTVIFGLPGREGGGRVWSDMMIFGLGSRSVAGAEFAKMNPGLARHFPVDRGLIVLEVADDSPAHRAGLRAGDVVVRASGESVESVGELRLAVERADGDRLLLVVARREGMQTLTLSWE